MYEMNTYSTLHNEMLSVHRSIYRYCSLVFRQFLFTKNYTENNKWKPRNQRIIKIDEFWSVGRCVEYTWYIIWCTTYVRGVRNIPWDIVGHYSSAKTTSFFRSYFFLKIITIPIVVRSLFSLTLQTKSHMFRFHFFKIK